MSQISQPPPTSAHAKASEQVFNGSVYGALGLVVLLFGVLLLLPNRRKKLLAGGYWAQPRHVAQARRQAFQQMTPAKRGLEIAFTLGLPRRFDDKRVLPLPDGHKNILLLGAPGTGKSYSGVDPAIRSALAQGLPVILFDYHFPLLTQRHAALAAERYDYQVHVFAPGQTLSSTCNLFDFIAPAAQSFDPQTTLLEISRVLHQAFQVSQQGMQVQDGFFGPAGEELLRGAMAAAYESPYPDLLMVQGILSLPNLAQRLESLSAFSVWTRTAFDNLRSLAGSERTTASIIGTASLLFNKFMLPSVLPMFMGRSTLPFDLTGRQLVVIGMDAQHESVVTPFLSALLHMLIRHNARAHRTIPLVTIIDELSALYLPKLADWLNRYRQFGLGFLLAAQNYVQLDQRYGREARRLIMTGCATKILMNPQDQQTAEELSKYLGQEEVEDIQLTRSHRAGRQGGGTSRANVRRTRPLVEAAQFLKMQTGQAIVISPGFAQRSGSLHGEGSLPYRTQIRIPQADVRLSDIAAERWASKTVPLLQSRVQLPTITEQDFADRRAAAEQLFPYVHNNEPGASG